MMSIRIEQWRGGLFDDESNKKCHICETYQSPLVVHFDFKLYKQDKQRLKRPRLKQICNTCKWKRDRNLGYLEGKE